MSEPTYFVDSSGGVRPVAPDEAPGAAELGWLPASPKQIEDFKIQAEYGSRGQQAIAGLEGLGRGLSLGLSTPVERALGVSAEGISGREKANPVTALVGEGAGIAGSMAVGLGGPSLAAKAGAGITRALAPEGATVAARILGAGAAATAGSAVEGAFYGAGRVVHEAALGDPNLTAQSALATIGLSAALLGGTSGAAKVLGRTVAEYTPKDLGAKVIELLDKAEAHSNFNATNAMPGKIKEVMRGKGSGATALGLEARDLGILKNPVADSVDAIFERASEVKNVAGQSLDQIATAASARGPVTTWTQVYQDIHEPIASNLRSRGATMGVADQFEKMLGQYEQAYSGRDLDVAGLWKLRQDFGDFIYQNGKVLDPWVKELNKPVKRVYDHVDSLILKNVGKDLAPAWETANRKYEVAATFATLAQSGIERSAANNPLTLSSMIGGAALAHHGLGAGGLGLMGAQALRMRGASASGFAARMIREALAGGGEEVANMTAELVGAERQAGVDTISAQATQEPQAVHVLAALERMNGKITRQIEAAASKIIRTGKAEAAGGISMVFSKSPDETKTLYLRRVGEIQKLIQDPEQLHRALVGQTDDWHQHAPKTAEAMNVTSARGIAFLASKIQQPPMLGPLAPKWEPSRDDMSRFHRYYEAVEHPLSVLKEAASGTLTPESVEALAAVHPSLLEKIRGSLIEKITSQKGPVPYQARLMLSMLMQQDMDGSLSQQSLAHAQASFLSPPVMPVPGNSKAGKIGLSQRTQTPTQSAANRSNRAL